MQYKVETLLPYKNDSSNVTVLIFKLFLILKHYKVNYTHDIFAPKYSPQSKNIFLLHCLAFWPIIQQENSANQNSEKITLSSHIPS